MFFSKEKYNTFNNKIYLGQMVDPYVNSQKVKSIYYFSGFNRLTKKMTILQRLLKQVSLTKVF